MQIQSSPIHNRALSPTKERSSPSKHPAPLPRKFSIRPASAAPGYSLQHSLDTDAVFSQQNEADGDELPVAASAASAPSHVGAASSPAARRLQRFAAMDARVSNTIDHMHAHTHMAAAMSGESISPLPVVPPSPSRPLSAALATRPSAALDDDRANSEEM
jgi:hypothetical protein